MSLCPQDCYCKGTYGHLRVPTTSKRHWGHTDISVYEQLPGDKGDIQTSHCMNGFQEGTLGTYGHPTVRTASRGHMDISLYERLISIHICVIFVGWLVCVFRSYSEMSVGPYVPRIVGTVRCPYVPMSPGMFVQ